MGEKTIAVLSSDQLLACNMSLDPMNTKTLELGMLKRGHQHLWNELARMYVVDKKAKITLDYKTGVITAEDPEPEPEGIDELKFYELDGKEEPHG